VSGERKITVQFDGEDVGLGSAASKAADDLEGLETATDQVAKKSMTAGEKMTALIGVASGGAIAFMGFQDASEGVGKALHGDFSDIDKVMQGMEGMGAGMTLLISAIPEQVTTWVVGHATMAASALASFASQIAEWAVLAATSLASAAAVAASWFLAVWPVALVIAIVVALVIVIIKNWDTIKRVIEAGWEYVKRVGEVVWNGIKEGISLAVKAVTTVIKTEIDIYIAIFKGLAKLIGDAVGPVKDAFLGPFKAAFDGIKSAWNSLIGGKGFTVPSWIPGVGGKSFTIPKLAQGGIVTSPTLALIGEAGPEAVVPLGRGGGVGGGSDMVHVQVILDSQVLIDALRKGVRNRGGTVQTVLG
jgi:hypothetical protein